jgi:hypothetical protein
MTRQKKNFKTVRVQSENTDLILKMMKRVKYLVSEPPKGVGVAFKTIHRLSDEQLNL